MFPSRPRRFLTAALSLLLMDGMAHAVELSYRFSSNSIGVNESVTAEIVVGGLGANGPDSLGGYDIVINYDSTLFDFGPISFGDPVLGNQLDLLGFGTSLGSSSTGPGNLRLFELSLDPPATLDSLQASEFVLASVTFDSLQSGLGVFQLSINSLSDASAAPLTGTTTLGVVAVSALGFNIDFGFQHGTPPTSFGAAASQAGTWNEIGTGTTALLDTGGNAVGASATVVALTDTGWITSNGTDEANLTSDNFFSGSGDVWTVDIAGIADGSYLVYLYAPAHPSVVMGDVMVEGMFVPSIPGVVGGALVEGSSYQVVEVDVADTTLSISGSFSGTNGLSGTQVVPVPVPEPSLRLLLAAGAASLMALGRRR